MKAKNEQAVKNQDRNEISSSFRYRQYPLRHLRYVTLQIK